MFRLAKKCALVIGILALVFLVVGWWGADQLAYPPRRPLQSFHLEFLANPEAHGVVVKTFTCADGTPCLMCEPEPQGRIGSRGQRVREQLERKNITLQPPGTVIGNLVLIHGRRGRKEDYLLIAERFCAAGFRCLLPDLPAHGDHPAPIAYYGVKEGHLPVMVLREAAAKFGFETEVSGIMGLSMGGAVSVRSAAENDALWRAAVLVSTFDSLENVVRYQSTELAGSWCGLLWEKVICWMYVWKTGLPLSAIDSTSVVAKIKCPVLVAHGTADHVIPISLGRHLFESMTQGVEKRWVEIPRVDHDNVLITDFPIYAEMTEWMLKHLPR